MNKSVVSAVQVVSICVLCLLIIGCAKVAPTAGVGSESERTPAQSACLFLNAANAMDLSCYERFIWRVSHLATGYYRDRLWRDIEPEVSLGCIGMDRSKHHDVVTISLRYPVRSSFEGLPPIQEVKITLLCENASRDEESVIKRVEVTLSCRYAPSAERPILDGKPPLSRLLAEVVSEPAFQSECASYTHIHKCDISYTPYPEWHEGTLQWVYSVSVLLGDGPKAGSRRKLVFTAIPSLLDADNSGQTNPTRIYDLTEMRLTGSVTSE